MENRVALMVVFAAAAPLALGACHKQAVKVNDLKPAVEQTALPPTALAAEDEAARSGAETSPPASERLDKAYFDFDRYQLRPDARAALDTDAKDLLSHTGATVRLEGNCDERGSTQYNLALGEERAEAARRYLVTLGVSPTRLDVVSYGKEKPADPAHNAEAWARNRRVELSVTRAPSGELVSSY